MKQRLIVLSLSALAAAGASHAQTAAEKQQLSARYQSDLKLCNTEADAAGRLQCKRDARTEYDKALAAAQASAAAAAAAAKAAAACTDCGRVLSVMPVERQGQASPVGLIAGGVVGGLLGNQVGGGTGKDLATLAGAAGGAYAGREVEKRMTARTVWEVKVDFGAAGTSQYDFAQDPGLKAGDLVRKSGNTVLRP